jgi:hypothetical protein
MKKRVAILALPIFFISAAVYALKWYCAEEEPQRYARDRDFILLDAIVSPNNQHTLVIYQYDIGALGETRVWWAVTGIEYQNVNLAKYELPDGYEGIGWSKENDLLVSKWEPYYYRTKLGELNTGDTFNGVKVKLVEPVKQ